MLPQNGESLVYVKDHLGHASIQITVDVYVHFIPGSNKQAVDGLDLPVEKPQVKGQSATPAQPFQVYPGPSPQISPMIQWLGGGKLG